MWFASWLSVAIVGFMWKPTNDGQLDYWKFLLSMWLALFHVISPVKIFFSTTIWQFTVEGIGMCEPSNCLTYKVSIAHDLVSMVRRKSNFLIPILMVLMTNWFYIIWVAQQSINFLYQSMLYLYIFHPAWDLLMILIFYYAITVIKKNIIVLVAHSNAVMKKHQTVSTQHDYYTIPLTR